MSKAKKVKLEDTQADEVEVTVFTPDEAPDHVHIRRDPIFDDVKVFRHMHHRLIKSPRQKRDAYNWKAKASSVTEASEKFQGRNEDKNSTQKEKSSDMNQNGSNKTAVELMASSEITLSSQLRQREI
ncbi:unnamed protein product [Thelazia callipaeda]|uniref:Ovule protein n=1 Tax=Thelazia callipaeda TaxID=103827 RepID=A0A0N5DA41_THECL|nr:unnamed protein product [Thelazia callipaeda]